MYMDYKRLFLNWIKQKDPGNLFEYYLRRNHNTLKNHVKNAPHFDHLIMFNSFSWFDTCAGFAYWAQLYHDWLEYYNGWARNHY